MILRDPMTQIEQMLLRSVRDLQDQHRSEMDQVLQANQMLVDRVCAIHDRMQRLEGQLSILLPILKINLMSPN